MLSDACEHNARIVEERYTTLRYLRSYSGTVLQARGTCDLLSPNACLNKNKRERAAHYEYLSIFSSPFYISTPKSQQARN